MIFTLIGVFSGILASMGLGGGSILIPLLSFVGVAQKSAQVINVFSFVVMVLFVLYLNIKNKLVEVFPAFMFGFVGMIFTCFSALLVQNLDSGVMKVCFGVFLLIVAVCETFAFLAKYKANKK